MNKRALIFGIGGQDGSHLAEILLEKGYDVYGMVRRSSVDNLIRIRPIRDRLTLIRGDLTDWGSLKAAVETANPQEVYNLADQDDARWSESVPNYQHRVTASAVKDICDILLRRCRDNPVRFFQPLSALMFGLAPPPQNEETPLSPLSPFAAAKVEAWRYCVEKRKFGLHVCCGIMFNHDTNTPETPVCLRDWQGEVFVTTLGELAPIEFHHTSFISRFEVWDNGKWSKIVAVSKYVEPNKPIVRLLSRSGYVECTEGHKICGVLGDQEIQEFRPGDQVCVPILPSKEIDKDTESLALAWVTGFFVGDGSLSKAWHNDAREFGQLKFYNSDLGRLATVEKNILTIDPQAKTNYRLCRSRYRPENYNHTLWVSSRKLKESLSLCYSELNKPAVKRVPRWVFNASLETIEAFLDGYCEADGTKALPNSRYKFQAYTTKSQVLAAGLRLLCHWTGRKLTVGCESRENSRGTAYYHKGFIRSPNKNNLNKGRHKLKDPAEVTKVWKGTASEFVTLTTESGTFSAGTGLLRIYNSPARSDAYALHKVCKAAARIKQGKQPHLVLLGNPEKTRFDVGYAKDYMAAAWQMLQLDKPDDYAIGTGRALSLMQMAELAFAAAGVGMSGLTLKLNGDVQPAGPQPTLVADAAKARKTFGFNPETTVERLIEMIVAHYKENPDA